jgi:hypothetical protein
MFGRKTPPGEKAGSSSSSSLAGILFAPFFNRSRMLTEETILVHNNYIHSNLHKGTMLESRYKELESYTGELNKGETESTCSSLSIDSRRRYNFALDDCDDSQQNDRSLIPQAIHLPAISVEACDEHSSGFPLPPVNVDAGEDTGRDPCAPDCETRWVYYQLPSSQRDVSAQATIGSLLMSSASTPKDENYGDAKSSTVVSQVDADRELLGNRPKRVPRHDASVTSISVSSIVGFSSMVTAPTATSWSVSESASLQQYRKSLDAKRRAGRFQAAKKELKDMLERVSSPIRRLAKVETDRVHLNRAIGSLT